MDDKKEQAIDADHLHHHCSYCDELTTSAQMSSSQQHQQQQAAAECDSLNLDLKIIIEKYGGLKAFESGKTGLGGAGNGGNGDELSVDIDDESVIAKSSIDLIQNELADLGESLRKNEKDIGAVDDGIKILEKELKELNARRAKCLAKNKKIRELIKLKAYLLCTARKNGHHHCEEKESCTEEQTMCCSSFASSIGLLTSKNAQDQKKGIEQLKDRLCDNNCDRETVTKEAIETNVTRQLVGLLAMDNLETDYLIDLLNILIQLASISCEARRSLTDVCNGSPFIFDTLQALKKKYPISSDFGAAAATYKGLNCKQPKVNVILNEKIDLLLKLIMSSDSN